MSIDKIARMSFKSKGNKIYTVEIYKRDAPGINYTLTPAADPFTTIENNSDDPMEPVRGSTGYLRFKYEGGINADGEPWWVDLMPADATEISVYLMDTEGVIMWQGYAKPSQYSHDYSEAVQDIELPLVSMLEVLDAIEMDATKVMRSATWRELLVEAMTKSGLSLSAIYLPYEWGTEKLSSEYVVERVSDFNFAAPLLAKVSRFAWFDVTDAKNKDTDPNWREFEGKSYKEMLADWCRFWGWTLRERGTGWWFVSRRTRTYCRIARVYLNSDTLIKTLKPTTTIQKKATGITLTDAMLDGMGHTLDVVPAVRTVEVDADTQEMDRDVLEVDAEKMEYKASAKGGIAWDDLDFSAGQTKTKALLYGPNGYPDIVGYCTNSGGSYQEVTNWAAIEEIIEGPTGTIANFTNVGWGKVDFYVESADPDKKNYNYKEGVIIANYRYTGMTLTQKMTQPIFEMKGAKSGAWRNGYFVIDPTVVIVRPSQKAMRSKGLTLQIEVGPDASGKTWKWNGTAWTDSSTMSYKGEQTTITVPVSFNMPVEFPTGNTIDTGSTPDKKTLDMDCNGAEGYIIPITRELEGRMTLRVLAATESDAVFMLSKFGVEYFAAEGEGMKDKEAVNKYFATTGATGKETTKIGLNLATENNNNPGHGLIKYGNDVATGETFMTPPTVGTEPEKKRPEEVLLNTARAAYGARRMKLKMELTMENREQPIDYMMRSEWQEIFVPVAEEIDWAEDRRKLTMIG